MKYFIILIGVISLVLIPIYQVHATAPTQEDSAGGVMLFTAIIATFIFIAALAQWNAPTTPQYKQTIRAPEVER